MLYFIFVTIFDAIVCMHGSATAYYICFEYMNCTILQLIFSHTAHLVLPTLIGTFNNIASTTPPWFTSLNAYIIILDHDILMMSTPQQYFFKLNFFINNKEKT